MLVVTDALLIASLKLAMIVVLTLTPVDPFVGETDDTVGGVKSLPPLPTVMAMPEPVAPLFPLSSTPRLLIVYVPFGPAVQV